MKNLQERLREKGIGSLSDDQLLSLILNKTGEDDRSSLSQAIDVCSPHQLYESLIADKGLDESNACTVIASLELGRRFYGIHSKRVRSAQDAYPIIQHYADRKQEVFIVMSLNAAHEVLATRVVSVGLVNRTLVHPREVFADPIQDRAVAIIIAHNHPSGDIDPSEEDREVTRRLCDAGKLLGIPILDHLIISPTGGYRSFVESGISMD